MFLTLRGNNTRVSDNRGHHIEILELNLLILEGCEGLLHQKVRFRNLTLTLLKCRLLSLMKL